MRRIAMLLIIVVGCGSGNQPPAAADAAIDSAPDAAIAYPACHEFTGGGSAVPVHVTGVLSGADVTSPAQCATIDAPYGIETAGADSVVRIDGLIEGMPYIVHLRSVSDLSFYVVTGCSTPTGPSASECLLFEDASTAGDEVGQFVAPATSVYVVVDYYASSPPSDASFTLDVYTERCTTSVQCGGALPVCVDGACVACASDFDCTTAAAPRCDGATNTCAPGVDACLADDPGDPANDGPAGAPVLALDVTGRASSSGDICSDPDFEADYVGFDVVTVGDTWDLSLTWAGTADLDLELYGATGQLLGLSYWEQPEHVRLTYLAPGRYYARVTEFSSSPDPSPVPYTLLAHRTAGAGCTTSADCAAEFRNQLYRGSCVAGACVSLDGAGAVSEGGACDSESDCAAGLQCPSFFFIADADTREVCARDCIGDSNCAPLGTDYVCTTYLQSNFCVQKCTDDSQCPTAVDQPPPTPPWYRLSCDLPTGRCLP